MPLLLRCRAHAADRIPGLKTHLGGPVPAPIVHRAGHLASGNPALSGGALARSLASPTMESMSAPTLGNGKICYLELPADDIARSVAFYAAVFGWNIRRRGDGSIAFDDGVGEVSGTWVTGRPPSGQPGLLIYIMVDDAQATVQKVLAQGGEIVQPIGADAPEITARFRDPAGNVLGIFQEH